MNYTVSEVAKLTRVSKVSIYNKLKLKEIERCTYKNKGVTYISEDGLYLIKESLNLNEEVADRLDDTEEGTCKDIDSKGFKDDLNYKADYINSLKDENEKLWMQMDEKDNQISDLLLRVEQMSKPDYINSLKDENEKLWMQMDEKDKQISDLLLRVEQLSKLVENSQVLLRDKEERDPLLLEEHFKELNNKIETIKETMNKRTKANSFWDKFKNKRD